MTSISARASFRGAQPSAVALVQIILPPLNPRVRHTLASLAVRDPRDAAGRLLYLQRLGALVLPHHHDSASDSPDGPDDDPGGARTDARNDACSGGQWACTLAGGTLDARTVTGAFWVDDVEIAAALELHDPVHPHIDMTVGELCATWMVRVWDRWPGGRVAQVADALLAHLDPNTLTVPCAPPWPPELARRAGVPLARALGRPCAELAAAGLLAADRQDPSRARLTLPVVGVGR